MEDKKTNKRTYSQAQNKATQKYMKNNYDDIKIRVPKGMREVYKSYAESIGKSLQGLIIELLEKERHNYDR